MHPRETFTPGSPVVIPMDEKIVPQGAEGASPAQLILMNLPQGSLGALPAEGGHIEVVFLADPTLARPEQLLVLPWSAAVDGTSAAWSVLRMAPDRVRAGSASWRAEQAVKFGREHGCRCVATRPAPVCYEPTW